MSAKASLFALVAGLAGLWSFSGSAPPPAAEPPVRLSTAHAHDNLTVFVLRGRDVLESRNILTLQEALERGLAVVHETSNVNQLEVENLSVDHELFLQSGDIVKGGKQDRLISQDMLVQAKSGKVPCPANCCEQSRWTGRGKEAAGKFEKSTDFACGNDIRIANVSQQQDAVWDNVAKKQAALSENVGKSVTANPSPTSLQLALEDKDLRAKVAAYKRDLAGLANAYPDAVGVVIAVNGQVIASDVYGSRQLFQKAWPKLLKSAAADAVAQMPKDGTAAVATREEAERFLATNDQREAERAAPEPARVLFAQRISLEAQNDLNLPAPQMPQSGNARTELAFPEPSQPQGFSGRSSATRESSLMTAGGRNGEPATNEAQPLRFHSQTVNPANAAVDNVIAGNRAQPQSVASTSAAVVSFESRAGSQGNALLHRGQLKK